MKIFNSGSRGFTLIELLVVISIIGILAGIFLNKIGDFRKQAEDARRLADLRHVQTLLELFYNKCNLYPANGVDPATCTSAPQNATPGELTWDNLRTNLVNAGIGIVSKDNIPKDPDANRSYQYISDGSNYVLRADLKKDNQVLKDSAKNNGIKDAFKSLINCDTADSANEHYSYCIEF